MACHRASSSTSTSEQGHTRPLTFLQDDGSSVLSLWAGTRSMRVQPFQPRSSRIAATRSAPGADSTMVVSSRSTNRSSKPSAPTSPAELPGEADGLPHVRRLRGDVEAIDARRPRVGFKEHGEDPHGRGLARPVGTEQGEDVAPRHVEVHAAQHFELPVGLLETLHTNRRTGDRLGRHGHLPPLRSCSRRLRGSSCRKDGGLTQRQGQARSDHGIRIAGADAGHPVILPGRLPPPARRAPAGVRPPCSVWQAADPADAATETAAIHLRAGPGGLAAVGHRSAHCRVRTGGER